MSEKYVIVATNRNSKKREVIFGPTEDYNIIHWSPTSRNKKTHKYFKSAKHPYKAKR